MPATGYWGGRAPRFVPNAPLAESAYARVSETRDSGFESRVGYQSRAGQAFASPAPALPEPRGLLFDNSDVASASFARRGRRSYEARMNRMQTWLNGQSATSPASRRRFEACCLRQGSCRLRVRIAVPQTADAGSNPAGNSRTVRGRSSTARASALQAERCRLNSDRLHQLAVAQLASAPRSGR